MDIRQPELNLQIIYADSPDYYPAVGIISLSIPEKATVLQIADRSPAGSHSKINNMKQTKWFDRQFPIIRDNGLLPTIVERLDGTSARLFSKIQRIDFTQVRVIEGKWSIKKEIGHLLDLEPLWLERAQQILNKATALVAADLTNKKTNETNHDDRDAIDLVTEFSNSRQRLVDLLHNVKDKDLDNASVHPRLGTPMKLVDLAYFVAEHDDHHLAKITLLSHQV